MSRSIKGPLAAMGLAIGWLACSSVELAPPTIKTRTGPALDTPIHRIVAIPTTCGSLSSLNREGGAPQLEETDRYQSLALACPEAQTRGVDQIVRSALEFNGYTVIDSERVNAVTMDRYEILTQTTTVSEFGKTSPKTRQAIVQGSRFEDAPPMIQDTILAELGAEGLLNARILIGAPIGRSLRRHIDVQVRLLHLASGELVWASRCRIEAGWSVNEENIAGAARCAIERMTGASR